MDLAIILAILIIIMLFTSTKKNVEGFCSDCPRGADEFNYSLPRKITNKKVCPGVLKDNHLKSLMWETRFPGLVGHRYSYNDKLYANIPQREVKPDMARLNELPLHLKNRWNATIDSKTLASNPFYKADVHVHNNRIDKNTNYNETHNVENINNALVSPIQANPCGHKISSANLNDYGLRHNTSPPVEKYVTWKDPIYEEII